MYRICFTKLIAQNHKLPIVSGRWLFRPFYERLCTQCQVLGDAYHFVLICSSNNLESLISRLIIKHVNVIPSMFKFIKLISSTGVKTINNLSIFIHKGIYECIM